MPSYLLEEFTDAILDRLAGTVQPEDSLILAANIHDAYEAGYSVDEFFEWMDSGKSIVEFSPNKSVFERLQRWREEALENDPTGAICGRCKKDNDWYDDIGWYYWWPKDATGKPDGLPPVAVCNKCFDQLGLKVADR